MRMDTWMENYREEKRGCPRRDVYLLSVTRDTEARRQGTMRMDGSGRILIRMTSCPVESPGPAHAP